MTMKLKEVIESVKGNYQHLTFPEFIETYGTDSLDEALIQEIKLWALEMVGAPIRAGDRLPTDEVIEDGAREALVRTVIKEAIEDAVK